MKKEGVTAKFCILGPPQFFSKGKLTRFHSAKAAALLAYLVCRPEIVHSREALATLLWSSYPERKARQSLRQALYSLRRALVDLADPCLVTDSQTIAFYPNPQFFVDFLAFDGLLEAGNSLAAAKLYQGDLLEGIALDDSPAFEEWLFWARDRTAQHIIGALQDVVDDHLASGHTTEAIHYGRLLVSLDPLNESAYRQLMRAQDARGDPDAIARLYRQCRDCLQRELGVEPAYETTTLYQQLLATKTLPLPEISPPTPVPTPSFPFQGCESELAQLENLYKQAKAGEMSLVIVKGEAGSGKTELVLEFTRRAQRTRPLLLLSGRAYETQLGVPYTMWTEAFSVLETQSWRARLITLAPIWQQQLARLVPGISAPVPDDRNISSAESHLRFMQGIVQSLIHLASDDPLMIFFDDLHWSDTASLELLQYAARQCRAHPILIVGTYRSDAINIDAGVQRFINKQHHETIELSPLRQSDIKALLAWLGHTDTGAAITRLDLHSQGNRFMLVETLRFLQESGSLDLLFSGESLPIPPRIQEMVETRMTWLGEQQRRVMAAAAVIGRPFDITLLHHVSGRPELALLEDVETLIAHAFLEENESGNIELITFHHDFVRQVTYEGLFKSQRRALHRRTADALLRMHKSRQYTVVEEVAFHYEQATDSKALDYLLQASKQAESLFALSEATRLLSRALAFQAHFSSDAVSSRFEILLARENLLAQQGRRAAQDEDIAELISLAEAMDDPSCLAQAWVRRAGYLNDTGQSPLSKQAAEEALSLYRIVRDKQGEAQALRELGFLYWSTREYGLALDYGRQVLRLHRLISDIDGEASALHNLAEIHRGLGSPSRAVDFYGQSMKLSWARQDPQRQSLSLYGMAHALRQLGRNQTALEMYQQTVDQAGLAGDKFLLSRVYHEMGVMMAETGELDQALITMRQAAAISRETGYAAGLAHSLIGLSYLYNRLGQIDEARTALGEAMEQLQMLEDKAGLQFVTDRMARLNDNPDEIEEPPSQMGWVRTYVTLGEGKVYCEYESPLARA